MHTQAELEEINKLAGTASQLMGNYEEEDCTYWREDCPACRGKDALHVIYKYELDEQICFCEICHHHLTRYDTYEKNYPAVNEQKKLTTTKGEKMKNDTEQIKPPTKKIMKQGILREPPEKAGD